MIQIDNARQRLQEVCRVIEEAGEALNLPLLEDRKRELEAEMAAPDFWNEIEHAQSVNQKMKVIDTKLSGHAKLVSRADDLLIMMELCEEEQDDEMAAEITEDVEKLAQDAEELRLTTLLRGEYDGNNAILTLHAGAGGTEAQDWTQMLYRMYTRWAERRGYDVKLLDFLDGDEAGIKSVTFSVSGPNAYGFLKCEKGVHRLVRISPFDASARRHTSFASLEVMPEIEEDNEITINPDDLRVDTYRSTGAGGQHINKTDSAVRITHLPTGIVVSCQTERSQIQNRAVAMSMLRARLAELKERETMEKLNELHGELKKIEWGSQIRSYVFQPYTMVKDHRTGAETGNITAVMDGDLDLFIHEYLVKSQSPTKE